MYTTYMYTCSVYKVDVKSVISFVLHKPRCFKQWKPTSCNNLLIMALKRYEIAIILGLG